MNWLQLEESRCTIQIGLISLFVKQDPMKGLQLGEGPHATSPGVMGKDCFSRCQGCLISLVLGYNQTA